MKVSVVSEDEVLVKWKGKMFQIKFDERGVEVWQVAEGGLIFLGKLCYRKEAGA